MFGSLPWYLSSIALIFFVAAVAVICILLVRKKYSLHDLKSNHEIAGYFLGTVGVLYSVLLGFTVINAQNRYNQLHDSIHEEAVIIGDLYRDAQAFPKEKMLEIRANLINYTKSVIEDEWAFEGEGIESPITHAYSLKVWNSYYDFEPLTEKGKVWYLASVNKLDELNSTRLARLFTVKESMGGINWALLVLGATITVALMLFFGLENIKAQLVMTSAIAAYLAFILFLIYSLDNAFTSQIAITPEAFHDLLSLFHGWD